MFDIIIVGGGIAGLVNAILLSRSGLNVALFEKKSYPLHRVCGEYISNEVKPFLVRNGLYPQDIKPIPITRLCLTSTQGNQARLPLGMGGFGISRFAMDQYLFEQAKESGVTVFQNSAVSKITFSKDGFQLTSQNKTYGSRLVIGAHGKRSTLDRNRKFMHKKSPYVGVKYHISTDLPVDEIALHNFKNGYCGVSQVEGGVYNLCYLSHRNNLLQHKSIARMEQKVVHQNPFLHHIWRNSDFLFEEPLVINEISFEKKELVYNHILMCGDTAGMITPLCGNGMAMAIRSANILSKIIQQHWNQGNFERSDIESNYIKEWNKEFSFRLWSGRQIQKLFGSEWSSNLAVQLAKIKPIGKGIIGMTHGQFF